MKICNHSEVIGEMFILETNAWQTCSKITQKQTFTKFQESFIYFIHTFFTKNVFKLGLTGQINSPESPEITEMTEYFTKVTKYLTKSKETLINYG